MRTQPLPLPLLVLQAILGDISAFRTRSTETLLLATRPSFFIGVPRPDFLRNVNII
ncbi:hypothetical protein [Rubidibacter lacunae]|uniref:hypothetical protein n=1 Tax=Rubidibacter lacunae TaxID=582514 RepID=UPI000416CEFE|nr:hypothetical protein [Rubidibacter lacunae]